MRRVLYEVCNVAPVFITAATHVVTNGRLRILIHDVPLVGREPSEFPAALSPANAAVVRGLALVGLT
jgi:hypothetical protein